MKKILVTTDFSVQSRHTLKVVLDSLKDITGPCQIILLNTYLVKDTDPDLLISLNDELKQKSKARLEEEKAWALGLNKNNNISITITSHIGTLNNVIQILVKREQIDMVAMGREDTKALEAVKQALKDHGKCSLFVTEIAG